MFHRNIVYNPKDSESYLYLAKIFKIEEDIRQEEKNIKTTLLLDPMGSKSKVVLIFFSSCLISSSILKILAR